MALIPGFGLVLVLGIFWAYWYGSDRHDNDEPFSVAIMLAVISGLLACAAFVSEEPKWAPVVVILASVLLWGVGGQILTVVDAKFFQGPVVCSFFVQFGMLLVHIVDWALVLEATAGSMLACTVLAYAIHVGRGSGAAVRR